MPDPIVIKILVQDDGSISLLGETADALKLIKVTAADTGGGASAGGVFGGMVQGAADAWGAVKLLSASLNEAGGLIADFNNLGTAVIRSQLALTAMSGGSNEASGFMNAMRTASGGVVDNLNLAQDATLGLSLGVARTQEAMATLTREGSILGLVFLGSAQAGIDTLERLEAMPGNYRGLKQLGIDASAVKEEFALLKKEMPTDQAWLQAVGDNVSPMADKMAGALTSTGTAVEKLTAQMDNLKQTAATNVAIGLEATINLAGAVAERIEKAVTDFNKEHSIAANLPIYNPSADQVFTGSGKTGQEGTATASFTDANGTIWYTASNTAPGGGGGGGQLPNEPGGGGGGGPTAEFLAGVQAAQQQWAANNGYDPTTGRAMTPGETFNPDRRSTLIGPQLSGNAGAAAYSEVHADDSLRAMADNALLFANNLAQGASHVMDVVQGSASLGGIWDGIKGKARDFAEGVQAAVAPVLTLIETTKNYQSLAEAFGTSSGGIAGQLSGGLANDEAAIEANLKKKIGTSEFYSGGTPGVNMKAFNAQQALAKQEFDYAHSGDKNFSAENRDFAHQQLGAKIAAETSGTPGVASGPVYTRADYAQDLAKNKEAMDAYRIASGQATAQSIAFDDGQKSLSEAARAGKISFEQEAEGLLAMATAAKTGQTSIRDLDMIARDAQPSWKALDDMTLKFIGADRPNATGLKSTLGSTERKGQTDAQTADPFADLNKSSATAKTGVEAIGTAMTANIGKAVASGIGTAIAMLPALLSWTTLNGDAVTTGGSMQKIPGIAGDAGKGVQSGMQPALDVMDKAKSKLDDFTKALNDLNNKKITIQFNATGLGGLPIPTGGMSFK